MSKQRGRPPGGVVGVVEGQRARPERYGPHEPGLHAHLLGLHPALTAPALALLVGIQRLLQLLL